jgi:hypothetical protein
MRCALVNLATGKVENVVTANESDVAESGYALVPSENADIGYDADATQVFTPPPSKQTKAEAALEEQALAALEAK